MKAILLSMLLIQEASLGNIFLFCLSFPPSLCPQFPALIIGGRDREKYTFLQTLVRSQKEVKSQLTKTTSLKSRVDVGPLPLGRRARSYRQSGLHVEAPWCVFRKSC